MLKKIITAIVTLGVVGLFAGCNTVEGVGKDFERGGEKLQGTAKDAKEGM